MRVDAPGNDCKRRVGMPDAAVPIAEVYARTHREFSDRVAIRDDRRQLTFAELGSQARKFANAMRAKGHEPDARVVMIAPNSCEWVIADQGMALGGYTRVGVLPRLHASEVAQIAEDIDPSLVIVDSAWLAENGADWIPEGIADILILGDESGLAEGHTAFAEFVAA